MNNRLLLVESSATMRYVLDKHAQALGFVVDVTDTYEGALQSLRSQYQQFGSEYSAVLFGWPSTPQDTAAAFAAVLEQSEFTDLPVVVMSTDLRAETRAWVAGRENTAVLSWKEYQGLEPMLRQLLDIPVTGVHSELEKFDNGDIHLLVVDDSATIRHSLRDLFRMQGYQVSLAATADEALGLATTVEFDIAVLDFYLQETTGDLLCRDLIGHQGTGDIVCTVLTGTYSDHIIKRSLRAGAVECMFKNESSELLLSRIDAISRFVRQRRELQSERSLLQEIIESLAGAVMIVEPNKRISYLSAAAIIELKLESASSLLGLQSDIILEPSGPQSAGTGIHAATWRLPDGNTVDVDYEHVLIKESSRSVFRFARRRESRELPGPKAESEPGQERSTEFSIISDLDLNNKCRPLLIELQNYLDIAGELTDRISLLVLDVFVKTPNGRLLPVTAHNGMALTIEKSLSAIYRRSGHVAVMRENRYAFLLRHREEPQAYLLVRKIMQLCLETDHSYTGAELACSGSLLSISGNAQQSMDKLFDHAFKGVDLVNTRAPNQTLILDLRRMLSAYPVPEGSSKHKSIATGE
ncbi:MAG: DNA-binding response OmpR family regulator [Granulosicoccus sp.]